MKCVKCGREMDENDRWCFYCGNISTENKLNNDLIKMANSYLGKKNECDMSFKSNRFMYITNIIILFLIFIMCIILYVKYGYNKKDYIVLAFMPVVGFYIFCFELLFKKSSLPWYGIFIPIYNSYLIFWLAYGFIGSSIKFLITILITEMTILVSMYSLIFRNIITVIAIILSIAINVIIYILIMINIADRFKQKRILLVLFPYIMIPFIALNKGIKYDSI